MKNLLGTRTWTKCATSRPPYGDHTNRFYPDIPKASTCPSNSYGTSTHSIIRNNPQFDLTADTFICRV